MSGKTKTLFVSAILVIAVAAAAYYLSSVKIPVLETAGPVGGNEKHLILIASILSAIVVIPVFALTIFITAKYRADNHKADYRPDWDGNRLIELTWWAIPGVIITILSVVAWNSAHALDPFKALAGSQPPLKIQVISLDWKWLFIYPDQGIATVNKIDVPIGQPVNFHVTSDTVMDSFWVPALGGQIYSMPGMDTQLNLQADKAGSYQGRSANISGRGFSAMDFTVTALPSGEFDGWMNQVKSSGPLLDLKAYDTLAKPGTDVAVSHYSSVQPGLYGSVLDKYMAPVQHAGQETEHQHD
ncbi:MAG TPA: ubiquinol oxidase subunit II [Candidatus Saccharimonadales bacterium]|nr:ubiquinol oxidase subunit II [Candidatus Saccharimonadales bacterium]